MESERNLMTTTEAARYLGLKPSYLYKMMMRRAIPYYKPGGKLCFFAKEDLDAWLKRVRVKSQVEIDSEASHYLVTHEKTNDSSTFLEQCSYGQFKEHGTGYQECHGSGIPEQGTEKEREQTRNQREGTDHSGLSSRLFPLRGRFHTGNGRLRDGQRRYRND